MTRQWATYFWKRYVALPTALILATRFPFIAVFRRYLGCGWARPYPCVGAYYDNC